MFQKILSSAAGSLDACPVEIEVDVTSGIPYCNIIGVGDTLGRGIRERVRSALVSSGYPLAPHKITVNLASSHKAVLREGLDLPIAIGILCAEGYLPSRHTSEYMIVGTLSLNGELRPVPGILNMALLGLRMGITAFIVPYENAKEASMIQGLRILPVHTLKEAAELWCGHISVAPCPHHIPVPKTPPPTSLLSIRGQSLGKRILEIACAGFHNLLLCGPPGCGKTLLLQSIACLLPPPTESELQELLQIQSTCGERIGPHVERPVRQPHHTLSTHALIGGGHPLRPGELTRAHGGILLMDELAEFSRPVLENLRQPLEAHSIRLHYLNDVQNYPADFMLAAAMNLCPCGHYPDPERCTCPPSAVYRYQARLGAPLLERIELHLTLEAVSQDDTSCLNLKDIEEIRTRIQNAVEIQKIRFSQEPYSHNSRMDAASLSRYCRLTAEAEATFRDASRHLGLSMRTQAGILKTARSIADLAEMEQIEVSHLLEALQYRPKGITISP